MAAPTEINHALVAAQTGVPTTDQLQQIAPPTPTANNNNDSTTVVLEDFLAKQGSRSKNFWHDRYFVLTADGTLAYYHKKAGSEHGIGDLKPKASLLLNQLPDCEVSELFVAKQNKQLLYCVKVTWSVVHAIAATPHNDDTGGPFSDNESTLSGGGGTAIMVEETDQEDGGATNAAVENSGTEPAAKKKRSIFRKKKQRSSIGRSNSHQNLQTGLSRDDMLQRSNTAPVSSGFRTPPRTSSGRRESRGRDGGARNSMGHTSSGNNHSRPPTPGGHRSIDGESLTMGTRQRVQHPPRPPAVSTAPSGDDLELVTPRIPAMVEVQEANNLAANVDQNHNQQPSLDHSEAVTVRAGNNRNITVTTKTQAYQDDEMDSEMEYLRSQFLATEKEKKRVTKRKVADGAKFAAAAGAAVGVAVVTVGIGLVAGLVALGIGAAAGASGTATGVVWKKKRDGEIVIGSTDYDKMRRWKACLDASLNSGILQKSKWGQLFVKEREGNKRRMLIFPKDTLLSTGGKSGHAPDSAFAHNNSPISPDAVGLSPRNDTGGAQFYQSMLSAAKWVPLEGGWTSFLGTGPQGLRIFREEDRSPSLGLGPERSAGVRRQILRKNLAVDGRPCPPVKAHLVLNATPLDAFLCLMSQGQLLDANTSMAPLTPNSGQRSSFRIIESIDDNTDVIHLVCNPLYLFPSWTSPRDFVLYRYWRLEEDGSFIVCLESVQHKDCPTYPGYCRGEMHQVFTVAPHKKTQRRKQGGTTKDPLQECLMTAVVQVDPKGWVPIQPLSFLTNQGYGDAFSVAALMQLLDIRDAIDQDRFIPVSLDDGNLPFAKSATTSSAVMDQKLGYVHHAAAPNIPRIDSMGSDDPYNHVEDLANYDFSFANRETIRPEDSPTGLATTPPALLPERWAEPDANSFRVRGKDYKEDRKKINAGASIGRLVAVDVVQVDGPIYTGMTIHPTERVQLALKKEKQLKEKGLESDMPPFLFVVNIVLPGPPFYHGVFYYAIDDMSVIDGSNGTPSSLLCKEFIFGESDVFRDKTFKLIPQIVQGNFIVRKAVGSTPAIMGKKLRQIYVRTPRSFELVLDCGSSPVATGVIRLSLGYAKTLVVDMGFLLEGNDYEHLPERLLGSARIRQLEFGPWLRKVEQPPSIPGPDKATITSTTAMAPTPQAAATAA